MNKIGKINPTDGTISEYLIPKVNSQPFYIIAAGPDEDLWFTESNGNQIGRITTAGSITEYPLPTDGGARGPYGIAAGPDGNLWFTENGVNKIGKINPTDGTITEYLMLPRRHCARRHRGRPGRQPLVHRVLRGHDWADHPGR